MRFTGDDFIKLGFWAQLVMLFLLDWASVLAFSKGGVPWYHYIGFAVMNVVLLAIAWKMWGWLRTKRSPAFGSAPRPTPPPADDAESA